MSETEVVKQSDEKTIGRNEPCPCGSRKKYKRCCGVGAAPKLTAPKEPVSPFAGNPELASKFNPESMDPAMMAQVAKAIQKLPRGQIQRLQSIMQKAMSGKDVTAEAQALEKSLPLEFQSLMATFGQSLGAGLGGDNGSAEGLDALSQLSGPDQPLDSEEAPQMSEEEARALVAEAAATGAIPKEQAEELLKPSESAADSKLIRFWQKLSGKK